MVLFITGIDTNVGKSIITGVLAKTLLAQGVNVTTQKLIQTGNTGFSEDIEIHRQIMGIKPTPEDEAMLTAPCIRSYPCSPHLAAKIDNNPIQIQEIEQATAELEKKYDLILLEGAGGIMVPITDDLLTIDYIAQKNYPVVLVTSGKLGSLNHTLLTLEAIKNRGIQLHSLIYNLYPSTDEIIEAESLEYLKAWVNKHFPNALFDTAGEYKSN